MIVTFEDKYLQELYVNGATGNRKYRYQPSIIKRYKNCIDILKNAPRKETLFAIKSLHFESLKGNKRGRFSIRVNDQYRLEFTISENLEIPVLTICNIVELSNHYA